MNGQPENDVGFDKTNTHKHILKRVSQCTNKTIKLKCQRFKMI